MNSDHFKICLDTGHVQTFTNEVGEVVLDPFFERLLREVASQVG